MSVTGKMAVANETISGGVEILNRPPYEGVSMTLADDAFTEGKDVIKAGSLITKDAKTATSGADAVGILLFDVYKNRPQGTILKKAYVNVARIKESLGDSDFTTQYGESGANISDAQTALPMIVFEEIPSGE